MFPGSGNRYLVDFGAFRVQLFFASDVSLTYTGVAADGTLGGSETVTITTEPIGADIYLVTWQETDKTVVVHVEDYARQTIITNIVGPDLQLMTFHGTMQLLPTPAAAPSFTADILPLFRPGDVSCMRLRHVLLNEVAWMSTPANAEKVYEKLLTHDMPPDHPWPDNQIALFRQWIDGGFQP